MMDLIEVKKIVRALLLSTKNGLSINELCSEYSAITGQALPYKDLGYHSAVDLVKDMPDVVRPIFLSGGVLILTGIPDSSTTHINNLVRGQRSTRYTSKIVQTTVKKPIELVVPNYVRNKISTLMRSYPRGVEISTFDKAYERQFGRRIDFRSLGFHDIKSVLLKCNDILTMKKMTDTITFIYPINLKNIKGLLPTPKQNPYSNNSGIPQATKIEIFSVLSKFKLGLWSSRFMEEYKICFQKPFKLHELGFNSIIELMSKVPEIARVSRPNYNGDWILQPAIQEEKLPVIITDETEIHKEKELHNGQKIDIYISYIVTPSSFWFQQVDSVPELESLMEKLNFFYNSPKGDLYTASDLRNGQICSALYEEDKQWYRAVIKSIVSKEKILVHYVDYGNEMIVNKSSIRLLLKEFSFLPFQACQAKLNISPKDELWTDSAVKSFFSLSQDKKLVAAVMDARNVVLDVYLNENKNSIAKLLERDGHGICESENHLEKVQNLKNYYEKYYEALKQVSALSTVQPKEKNARENFEKVIEVEETVKLFKSISINENVILTVVNHDNQPLVSSAEISSLFWNADILRQMSRQKGINLTREVIDSEKSFDTLKILSKLNVAGIITYENHKSIIMYPLTEIYPLFGVFKSKHENSEMLVKKEIDLWNQLGGRYWDLKYNKPSLSESNELKLQALKFKKKRLYMSMITNASGSNAMDEILAIEKEINILSLA